MSKIDLHIDNIKVAEIENKVEELNNHFVFVETSYINQLRKYNIPFKELTGENYYIVKRGKKPKKFNEEQQESIREDLKNLSIRKVAKKYNCSPTIISQIKNNTY